MKLFVPAYLLFFSIMIFSCSRNTGIEKDWNNPEVRNELKEQVKKDILFKEFVETQKLIQVKIFLKKGVDFTRYDSTAFLKASKSGKTYSQSLVEAGSVADEEYIQLQQKSKTILYALNKKYPGLRYFSLKEWNDLTFVELNKNFQENIMPYLKQESKQSYPK